VLCDTTYSDAAAPDGRGPGIEFWGNSFAVGPQGEFLTRANAADDIVQTDYSDKL
jgi:N-carbamoylputrescine amidase